MQIRTLAAFALVTAVGLSGCAAAEQVVRDVASGATGAASGAVQSGTIGWSADATDYRTRGGTYAFDCPPNPRLVEAPIWGTNPYSDDSAICWAGVHAGVISAVGGGRVLVQIRPGQQRYATSTRNGVRSLEFGAWEGSYAVVQ